MTDVSSQLEANGLPTQFESTANQPEVSHAIANTVASISNAEASQLKPDALNLEPATASRPVQPPEEDSKDTLATAPAGDVAIRQNGDAPPHTDEVQVNGHSSAARDTNSTSDDVSLATSVPSAIAQPDLDAPSNITADTSLITQPSAPPMALPDQAPVSDMRTLPHADALPPVAVAQAEANKHELDNAADTTSMPTLTEQAAVEIIQAEQTAPIPISQQPSPPPAPQPAPAALPSEPASVSEQTVPSTESATAALPVEQPPAPVPTPAEPVAHLQEDQEMTDAPPKALESALETVPVTKLVRDREDEEMIDEPVAKRLKTDEDHGDLATAPQVSVAPITATAPVTGNPTYAEPVDANDVVTTLRLQHMKKVISNLKKSNASTAFRLPVDHVALKIPSYPQTITRPMDLSTIDNYLKNNEYKSIQAFKEDFTQIIANVVRFNGPDHAVTQQGKKMETSFINQMANLPPTTMQEPSKADKKAMKPKIEPIRAPPPRRQSVNTKAASPQAASPATFAPDPNGMPLIRRDSALDGRPKRAIVPPKRNSDFGGARPKKKKYELELRFCDEILKLISSNKHWAANQYFTHAVDPVALNIPTYYQVVKKPMDLGTVRTKLDNGMYEKAKDFEEDVRLIFKNCYKFNTEGDYVFQRGQELEKLFSQEWAKKQDWITAREPDSEPASVIGDEDEEESEEEQESEDDPDQDQISKLQAQIEMIQSQMGQLKNKTKSPGAKVQKKKKVKREAPPTKFPGLQPKDKPKKPAKKPTKSEKDRYVTFAEKQYISNGIAMLPERPMQEALKIIQSSVPALANSESGEIELDIEEVPNAALLKLLSFVKKYAGPPPEEAKEPEYATPAAAKKKGKSMSKHEQEAHIAELKGQLHSYEKTSSPDAMQSIETGGEDSDDDDSNEESEEE